jgi:hypothetical protein
MASNIVFAIESIGVDGSTDRQLYFSKAPAPTWDTDNAFVESCFVDFPAEIASSVDFFSGDSSIGSLSVELFALAKTQAGDTIASILYNQIRVSVAELTQDLSKTDTNVYLDTTTLGGSKVVVGREVIYLGPYDAVDGRYESCVRGRLGTVAQAHNSNNATFTQVFGMLTGPILQWRRVTLYRYDQSATGYSDMVALWSGVVSSVSAPAPDRIRLDLDSAISAVEGSKILSRQCRRSIVNASNGLSEAVFFMPIDDLVGSATGALVALDGDCVVECDGRTIGGDPMIFAIPPFIYRPLDGSGRVQEIPTQPKEAWQVFHASSDRTVSTSSLPLSRNLLTCFIQILTTSDGSNGDYDVGSTAGADTLGLGIPNNLVDISTIERIRDELGDALETDTLVFGLSGEPVEVIAYFREALRPHAVAIVDKSGLISVAALIDANPDAATLIESSDLVGPAGFPASAPVSQTRRFDMSVDAYSVEFGGVPGFEPIVDRFTNAARRKINIYGEQTAPVLNLKAYQTRDRVTSIVLPLIQRFNDPIPQISVVALRTRTDIELGDLVKLTHSKVYRATGGIRGITGELCICIERALNLSTNQLYLRLLYVGALYTRQGQIGPSGVVSSSSGNNIDLYENYQDSADGLQSGFISGNEYDVDTFTAGDFINHCDSTGVVIQLLKIGSTSGSGRITCTSTPSPTPVDGDIVRLATYDSSTTTSQDRFAWLSDAAGTLGAANDAGKEYSF